MDRGTVIVAALVLAPWPVLILAAIARGYDVHLTMRKRRK